MNSSTDPLPPNKQSVIQTQTTPPEPVQTSVKDIQTEQVKEKPLPLMREMNIQTKDPYP